MFITTVFVSIEWDTEMKVWPKQWPYEWHISSFESMFQQHLTDAKVALNEMVEWYRVKALWYFNIRINMSVTRVKLMSNAIVRVIS